MTDDDLLRKRLAFIETCIATVDVTIHSRGARERRRTEKPSSEGIFMSIFGGYS